MLPIDRTSKSTLDTNLVNGNTSDAPAVKNSNDVVYNTIDELYNYSQGLVNAGILTQASKTPIANKIAQYDANANLVSKLPVANGQNPNCLFNPSFRLGSAGWTGIGTNGFGVAFGNHLDGGYLYNNASTAASGVTVTSQKIPVAAGDVISVTADINTVGVTAGGTQLACNAYDVNNVYLGQVFLSPTNGLATWTRYTNSFTTPANTNYVQLIFSLGSNTSNTFAAVRKMKVEIGAVATTFSDDNTLNTFQYGNVLPLLQVLSGGNKEQSGVSGTISAAQNTWTTANITFPTAFATAPQEIQLTVIGMQIRSHQTVTNVTTTGFTINIFNVDITSSVTIGWEATST